MRCILLIDTVPGLETASNPILNSICDHTIGVTALDGALLDDKILAGVLREMAAMLEAPNLADPEMGIDTPSARPGMWATLDCGHTGLFSMYPRADGGSQCTDCANRMKGFY